MDSHPEFLFGAKSTYSNSLPTDFSIFVNFVPVLSKSIPMARRRLPRQRLNFTECNTHHTTSSIKLILLTHQLILCTVVTTMLHVPGTPEKQQFKVRVCINDDETNFVLSMFCQTHYFIFSLHEIFLVYSLKRVFTNITKVMRL